MSMTPAIKIKATDLTFEDVTTLSEHVCAVIWSTLVEPGHQRAHEWITGRGSYAEALADLLLLRGDSVNAKDYSDQLGWLTKISVSGINRVFDLIATTGMHVVIKGDPGWPAELADLGASEPIILYGLGDMSLLTEGRRIALVGARAATGYGEHMTMTLTQGLVDRGFTIVSGAAYGIDGMAHRSALAAQGKTIAILAGGLDRPYPIGHDQLIQKISERGLTLSELPPNAAPTRWRFLQRNRLIAALSEGLVVVEAGVRSGSLNAAGHAHVIGRPIGAVPGPVTSPASAGCHRLLGHEYQAAVITEPQSIVEMLDRHQQALGDLMAEAAFTPPSEEHTVAGTERLAFTLAAHTGAELREPGVLDSYLQDAEEIGYSHPHLLNLHERGLA